MELSICIPVKNRSKVASPIGDLNILPNTIRSISEYHSPLDIEIIICDFESDDWPLSEWIDDYRGDVKVTIITIDEDFSSGLGRNVAAEHATSNALLFLDADCTITPEAIDKGLAIIKKGQIAFPFICFQDIKGSISKGNWRHNGTGVCFIPRWVFLNSDKWPEFNSWGGEDDAFYSSLSQYNRIRESFVGVTHQWHPISASHVHYKNEILSDYNAYVNKTKPVKKVKQEKEKYYLDNVHHKRMTDSILDDYHRILKKEKPKESSVKDESIAIVSKYIKEPNDRIDSFDNVLRCDIAPTNSFEHIVGSKTTHHFFTQHIKNNFSIVRKVDKNIIDRNEFKIPVSIYAYFNGLASNNSARKVTNEFIMLNWMLLFYKKVYIIGHFKNNKEQQTSYFGQEYKSRRLEVDKEIKYLNNLEKNNNIIIL